MPSLEYLRTDSADEIDPRSDFALASSFARFICAEGEPRAPFESIDRPSVADLRQEVALRLLEARKAQQLPIPKSCLVLVDSEPDMAQQAFARAKSAHYREQRRLRRFRPGTEPVAGGLEPDDRPAVRTGGYLNVAHVVQRIMVERKPGLETRVVRRVVVTMLDAQMVGRRNLIERRRILAKLRRLRRQTGLPLDVGML
jgi:hypothetical protein